VSDASLEPRWDRRTRLAFAVLVAGALASLAWLVHPWYEADAGTDDASMYILSAKALLAGEGYAYLGRPFTIRPPGFSVLIAPILAWRGLDFGALNVFISLFGVAGVALLFVLVRPRLGPFAALATAALVWLNPAYQRLCNQVMSDVPGVALALASLVLERRVSRAAPSGRRDACLGLCIALAAYVRSANALLLPAVVASRAVEHWKAGGGSWPAFLRSRVLALGAATLLALLPWTVRNAVHAPREVADQNFLASYSTGMWHSDAGDPDSPRLSPGEILERVPRRASQILSLLGTRLRTSDGSPLEMALGGALLAAALVVLVRRGRASEWFLAANAGVLSFYFAFKDRLALPVFLLALPAAVELAISILARWASAARARAAVGVCVAVLAVADFRPRERWDEVARLHGAWTALCSALSANLPADARLAASIGWHYSVYLDRPVHSLLFAVRRAGVAGVEDVIDKYGIDTVILSDFTQPERSMREYFEKRYGVRSVGRGAIVRVRN
jgi:hypothetical protein